MNFEIVNNIPDNNIVLLICPDGYLYDQAFYYEKEELRYFNYILEDFLSQIDNSAIKKQGVFDEITEYKKVKLKDDGKYSGKYLLLLFPSEGFNFGYWLSKKELIELKINIERGLNIIGPARARINL
jgi:hypothetical protein